jgi:hypothetical protein
VGIQYVVCGLTLEADRALPALVPAAAGMPSDVSISFGHRLDGDLESTIAHAEPFYASPVRTETGTAALRAWVLNGGSAFLLAHGTGVKAIVDRAGTAVHVASPSADIDPSDFLLELVLGFILRLRFTVCLHAAAVELDGQAILLAGRPGVGKSTIAAALARRGITVLTDDLAAIEIRKTCHVHIGPRRLRPRVSAEGIAVAGKDAPRVFLFPEGACFDIALPPTGARSVEPSMVAAICLLEPSTEASDNRINKVPPATALLALLADTWAARLQDRAMRAQEFEDVGALVATTPSYRLVYAARGSWSERASDVIERRFTKVSA